jgi:hypothetical protein
VTRRPLRARRRNLFDPYRSLPVLVLLSAVLAAACGSTTATASPGPPTTAPESSGAPTESSGPATGSNEPSTEPSSEVASPRPSVASVESPGPGASATAGGGAGAAACSGSDENRDFFASMAGAVDWPVYCPVLPDGWFVESGQYRLADGGRLEIVYRGPNRAQLQLDEGAFCRIQGGCVPAGQDVGPTAFDGQDGLLVALDDGSWAIALDREATVSWLLIVTGLDEATARSIAAALAVVEG